jgi:hypothetical protein
MQKPGMRGISPEHIGRCRELGLTFHRPRGKLVGSFFLPRYLEAAEPGHIQRHVRFFG